MPTYNSKCSECNKVHEYVTKVSSRENSPVCCGVPTKRIMLGAPLGVVDNPAFMSKYKHLYAGKG